VAPLWQGRKYVTIGRGCHGSQLTNVLNLCFNCGQIKVSTPVDTKIPEYL